MLERSHHSAALAAGAIFVAAAAAPASFMMTTDWISPDDGSWHAGGNWSTGLPPGPGEHVVIDVGAIVEVTHSQGATLVDILQCKEHLMIVGSSSLGVTTTAQLSGELTLSTTGGLLTQQPGSTIDLEGSTTWLAGEIGGSGSVVNRGAMSVSGAGEKTVSAVFENNAGSIEVAAGSVLHIDSFFQSIGGSIEVHEGATVASTNPLEVEGGEIVGDGMIFGEVKLGCGEGAIAGGGLVALADPRPSPLCPDCFADLEFDGDFQQCELGELQIGFFFDQMPAGGVAGGVAGETVASDRLTVSGVATLGGRLTVVLQDPSDPPDGASYTVLSAASIIGSFDEIEMPGLAGCRTFDVVYTPTTVQIQVVDACLWDVDGDCAVAVVDLLELLGSWGTDPGGPPDLDGDGDVGVTDLLALLAAWGPCL